MRRWRGQQGQQQQCLLCLFGVAKENATRQTPIRVFCTTPTRLRHPANAIPDRAASFPPIRQTVGKTTVLSSWQYSRSDRRFRKVTGSLGGKTAEPEPLSEEAAFGRVKSCLDRLYSRISTPAENDNVISQLETLDSDRKQWRAFRESVSNLFESPFKDLPPKQRKQHKELVEMVACQTYHEDVTNYLYFAYLDQALATKGLDVSGCVESIDLRYPTEWYPVARITPREVHLHIGPTNSGKTYNALKRLEKSKNGFYAGPLRLLAHEVYSRFNANGIPCDLITGDDVRLEAPEFRQMFYASTVEMVDVSKEVEVAVIDEIQMIADEHRGWAWTRALVGSTARELHLCGEARVLPLIRELTASMGDKLHVHQYERLNPLKVETRSLRGDFKKLRKGDCVVTFSIVNIHALRKQIERESGKRVAIVYGNLPPETRAQQAALFNDPDNDYDFLVASDAIGMGLNLSIKRIIFDSVRKFDGVSRKQLSIPQIKQIAGRAGRYRTSHDATHKQPDNGNTTEERGKPGFVTCVDEVDLPILQSALSKEAPPIRQAGLLPMGDFIIAYSDRLPAGVPHEYVMQRLCDAASVHPRFSLCHIREQISIARLIETIPGLSTADRCIITASPADHRTPLGKHVLRALARAVGDRNRITVVDVVQMPLEVLDQPMSPHPSYLERLEGLHKSLILFLWLSYRFTSVFMESEMAFHAKEMVEERINTYLIRYSANRRLQKRLEMQDKIQFKSVFQPSADDDYSEHASEDLAEEESHYSEGETTALTIDWSRPADANDGDLVKDEVQQGERIARVNG